MSRYLLPLACSVFALLGRGQDVTPRPDLTSILNFETDPKGGMPSGWHGGPPGTIFADDKVAHGGRWSVRLERKADSENGFSAINHEIPIDFGGKTLELSGYLRTEDVSEFAGLWMREDGDDSVAAFDNMEGQKLKGTNEWKEYTVHLPLKPEARRLTFGVLIGGTGKLWADDLRLLVDGKPLGQAPRIEQPKTALDKDHEFDQGSGIRLSGLSRMQIRNLVTLAKVWGFLKYHHPQITSGERHWDYDLFRVLPAVLGVRDRVSSNAAIAAWIDRLGHVEPCKLCARLDVAELHLPPDVNWIDDKAALGVELSEKLRAIYSSRQAKGKQFYVSLISGIGNASFDHEPSYPKVPLPDPGFQLLGLFRFYNIIAYWFPYRDVMGENWDAVLTEFIPRIALANDAEAYQREMIALIARVHDTHANLWSSLRSRPPAGKCRIPATVRFVEGRAVVAAVPAADGEAGGLKVGDVIEELNGAAVSKLVENWAPYYAASNEPTRLRDIAAALTAGECGETVVRVLRDDRMVEVKAHRVTPDAAAQRMVTHDLPGDAFRRLSNDVAYLKLSSVKLEDAASYIDKAAGTKGLIIDIRNYPSAFVVFALGSRLVSEETAFVRFTSGDLENPGAFHWGKPLTLAPLKPQYSGKVIIVVDEISQSQAEYTSMAFRAAPQAKVIGSTTAGADGNVSAIPLPGGLRSMISGIGVFYPDKRPTQRVGIVPDVEVKPTIAGIRAGRDEVLEEALRQILGPETAASDIEKMARH